MTQPGLIQADIERLIGSKELTITLLQKEVARLQEEVARLEDSRDAPGLDPDDAERTNENATV